MRLSFSTINNIKNCNYFWINKQSGAKAIEFDYFTSGKEAHRRIQDHVSGRLIDNKLSERGLDPDKWYFPIVEEVDRDPNCHFEIDVDGHTIEGYFDGLKPTEKLLEIKTGNYSPRDFLRSNQRKMYVLALNVPESVLINDKGGDSKIMITTIKSTEKDRLDALEFVREGIKIATGDSFDGGENINCHRCVYRDSCERSTYEKSRRL